MRLSEALRFDAREPDKFGAVKTMAARLFAAADAIDQSDAALAAEREARIREVAELRTVKDAWVAALTAENMQLRDRLAQLQEPQGHTAERVAEWLRERGYKVEKHEPE